MAQYIDKDALVAEIDKLKGKVDDESSYCNGWQQALRMLEMELDTLEVKEVDLEKKAELIANSIMIPVQANLYHTNIYNFEKRCFKHSDLKEAAKKGIELGLKTKEDKL